MNSRFFILFLVIFAMTALYSCRSQNDAEDAISEKILYEREGIYYEQWTGTKQFGTIYDDFTGAVSVSGSSISFDIFTAGNTQTSVNNEDIFLIKYDYSGTKKWTVDISTTSSDILSDVDTIGTGIVITGKTKGFLEDDETGENAGNYDIFTATYNSSGTEQWTDHLGSSADDIATGLSVDDNGNIYLTGYTKGDLFKPQLNSGSADIFLVRYIGGIVYPGSEIQLTTNSDNYAQAVSVDDNSNKYIAGYADGTMGYSTTNSGNNDIFLVKYNSLNVVQWIKMVGTASNDEATDLVVDSTNDVIYITGSTDGDMDGSNAGGSDVFLIKYDTSGTLVWQKQIGTLSDDYGEGVALDEDGNIYIAGTTGGNLDGDTNSGNNDVFIIKYDPSGDIDWSHLIGTSADDSSADVAVDSSSNIYVTGTTHGGLNGNTNIGGDASGDIFLVRYNSLGKIQ